MNVSREAEGWHRRLVPETREEAREAARTFLNITQWREVTTKSMLDLLNPWFAEGWCLSAIIRALDYTPDGARQRGISKNWEKQFKRKMSSWFDEDSGARLDPPVSALSPTEISEARAVWGEQQRRRGRRTSDSDQTRAVLRTWLSETERARHEDRVAEALRSASRRTAALDSIYPGHRLTEPVEIFDREVGLTDTAREREHHVSALRLSGLDKARLPSRDDPSYEAAARVLRNRRASYHRARSRARLDDAAPLEYPGSATDGSE